MVKNHLKRIAVPRTWVLARKERKFTIRPNPGAHSLEFGISLGVFLRDMVSVARTRAEAQKLLNNNEVLVDGKRRRDVRYLVGLFDVIELAGMKKVYRLTLDSKGRLVVIEVPDEQKDVKVCRVTGKNAISGGKIQLHLHDGKTIISDSKAKVGDSVQITPSKNTIDSVFSPAKGSSILLIKGKHAGDIGVLDSITESEVTYLMDDKKVETIVKNIFVVGNKEPACKIR